jgi:energy-coupling factor transporter ATP-binding protein EcfA2
MTVQKDIVSTTTEVVNTTPNKPFPSNLLQRCKIVLNQHGIAFVIDHEFRAFKIGDKQFNTIVKSAARAAGVKLKQQDISELNDELTAMAEMSGEVVNIYSRVAPIDGGIEIDVGDVKNTRLRVTAGVEIIKNGSTVPFAKNPLAKAMVLPAETGDIKLLKQYVNLSAPSFFLLTAYLSYTLAHPKINTSKFVILVLIGDGGAGKSFLCEVLINLLDPSSVKVQKFPRTDKDLAIATQHAHVSCFDNIRSFTCDMSDTLCIASTGGVITGRALYTNGDQNVIPLHAPIVLNGIHPFITEADLAQRCLTLHMDVMPAETRRSEAEMLERFQHDLPVIFRGLLDLISNVFKQLPNTKVTSPERMIDFSYWLAAMELADGLPSGVYQGLYSYELNEAQFDTLASNPLASAIIEFSKNINGKWTGMPCELLSELEFMQSNNRYSGLPSNAIALSKRLVSIRSSLLTQGINVELSRGKHRTITITLLGDTNNDY